LLVVPAPGSCLAAVSAKPRWPCPSWRRHALLQNVVAEICVQSRKGDRARLPDPLREGSQEGGRRFDTCADGGPGGSRTATAFAAVLQSLVPRLNSKPSLRTEHTTV